MKMITSTNKRAYPSCTLLPLLEHSSPSLCSSIPEDEPGSHGRVDSSTSEGGLLHPPEARRTSHPRRRVIGRGRWGCCSAHRRADAALRRRADAARLRRADAARCRTRCLGWRAWFGGARSGGEPGRGCTHSTHLHSCLFI